MKKKFIAIIPARKNSKGIKNKNSKLLNGKPLILYTIEAAKKSNIDKIFVSTDCGKIKLISKKMKVEVIDRPIELANDTTPMHLVLRDAIKRINYTYDAVITLQPTSPFRNFRHINEAIALYDTDPKSDSLVSVIQIPHNMQPYSALKTNKLGYLKNFLKQKKIILRRQEKQLFYARNGPSIIITDKKILKNRIYGKKLQFYEMSQNDSIDIDNYDDWTNAKKRFSKRN